MLVMNYIVQPEKDKRGEFYNYLVDNNYNVLEDKEFIINSPFPFIISTKAKVVSILNSVTCCAQASQAKKIITVEEFIKKENSQ